MNLKERLTKEQVLIKKCHLCGHLIESSKEVDKCPCCKKSFLPLNYFGKVHAKNKNDFENLFATCEELTESDLIRGIYVIW
jgi:hypothetical protein